jgi:decaprenylphospho-beta-D-erythro-pentofuranosid-2-ulose 2-reductase
MRDALGRYARIVVLGGGSEIGQAIAREVLWDGPATVVLAARRPSAIDAHDLEECGAAIERVPFDLRDPSTHANPFRGQEDADLVILAGGVLGDQATSEHDPASAREVAETNFSGAVSALTHAMVRLRAQGHGTIVVLSSVAAVRPRRSNFVYGSAKAGLDAFARGLQLESKDHGVHTLIVRPGFVRTEMTKGMKPLPLSVSAEDVGIAVAAALRRERAVVWVPKTMRMMALALTVLPSPLLRLL